MQNNKFDLNKSVDTDRGPVVIGIEKAFVGGFVTLGALCVANAFTQYGINPLNYVLALSEYTAR